MKFIIKFIIGGILRILSSVIGYFYKGKHVGSLYAFTNMTKYSTLLNIRIKEMCNIYEIYFENGHKMKCTSQTRFVCTIQGSGDKEIYISLDEIINPKKEDYYNVYCIKCDISQKIVYKPIIKYKKSLLKYRAYKISPAKQFYIDSVCVTEGLLCHNSIISYDIKKVGQYENTPIFKLFYKMMLTNSKVKFFDRVVKIIYDASYACETYHNYR